MTAQQRQEPVGQAPAGITPPLQHLTSATVAGLRHEHSYEEPEEDWQLRLRSSQQWICELLIKNQQLRMLLESAKAPEHGGKNDRNASSI
jgi:hypothetical protein